VRRRSEAIKPLRVRVEFGGLAAEIMRDMLQKGLDGPTMTRLVQGLALAELRRRMRDDGYQS
jgi:hypothetical protein